MGYKAWAAQAELPPSCFDLNHFSLLTCPNISLVHRGPEDGPSVLSRAEVREHKDYPQGEGGSWGLRSTDQVLLVG